MVLLLFLLSLTLHCWCLFKKIKIKTLIFLFLAALSLHCCAWPFSSCGEPRLLPRCGARASHCGGISGCRAWPLEDAGSSSCGSQALAWDQELWCMGLAAQQHIRSSWTSNQTCVPCIGRQILFFCFFNLI